MSEQNKKTLLYETGMIIPHITKPRRTSIVKTTDEEEARFAYDCGRNYLIRTCEENGALYTEEWVPSSEKWVKSCQNCFHLDVCGDVTSAHDVCSNYIHCEEIKQLREYKEEQERKRREGLIIDLPAPIGGPVLKISYSVMRTRIDTVPFSLEDFPEVGKTVFALNQECEAKEALEAARKRMNEAEKRRKESISIEDEFRRKNRW